MSSSSKFLPMHPKIIKKVNESPQTVKNSKKSTIKNSMMSNMKQIDNDSQIIQYYLKKQHQQISNLQDKVQQLKNQNNLMQQSLQFYNNQEQKKQLVTLIEKAKIQQEQVMKKINNCQKVQQSTTAQQYYLWQKKKKMDQFNKKMSQVMLQNKNQRIILQQACQKYKEIIYAEKQQIQILLRQIKKTQNQFLVQQKSDEIQSVQPSKINQLKQQFQQLQATLAILRQNNQILSSQLQDGLKGIQFSLRKSFQNSKSSLTRQIQSIKRQLQNSQALPSLDRGRTPTPNQAIFDYNNKMKQIQSLLSAQQLQQTNQIIKPYDWSSYKLQQYLDNNPDGQNINYKQKFENLRKQHEQYEKQIQKMTKQMQDTINQIVRINQKSIQVQSATNKIAKLLPFAKK